MGQYLVVCRHMRLILHSVSISYIQPFSNLHVLRMLPLCLQRVLTLIDSISRLTPSNSFAFVRVRLFVDYILYTHFVCLRTFYGTARFTRIHFALIDACRGNIPQIPVVRVCGPFCVYAWNSNLPAPFFRFRVCSRCSHCCCTPLYSVNRIRRDACVCTILPRLRTPGAPDIACYGELTPAAGATARGGWVAAAWRPPDRNVCRRQCPSVYSLTSADVTLTVITTHLVSTVNLLILAVLIPHTITHCHCCCSEPWLRAGR